MITGLSSDYMMRLFFGIIAVFMCWCQSHQPIRDRIPRYAFPLVQIVCILVLIHLPRLQSVFTHDQPVMVHFQSEFKSHK